MNEEAVGAKVGVVSLWASILGIVVPILIAVLVLFFARANHVPLYQLCLILAAGTELIALITGIIGRKSLAGKAGMWVSLVLIVTSALAVFLLSATPHQPVEDGPQVAPERSQPEAAR